jgi:hypothetical protein
MFATHRVLPATALLMLATALTADAQPVRPLDAAPASPTSSEVRTQLGTSVNNAGLQQSVEWTVRRLLHPGASPLTADAHLSFGSQAAMSPSYARLGVWGQYAPLSIVSLRVGVEPSQFFGTFDSLMNFTAQDVPFDNDTRRERDDAAAGRTLRVYATPTLRLRAGHVVALVSGDVERWASTAAGPWFYEPTRDTVLRADGSMLFAARSVLMYEHVTAAATRVGVGAILTDQQVEGRHLNRVRRAGGLVTLQSDGRWWWLKRPALNVTVARYLDDPSKDGEFYAAVSLATTLRRR